MYVYRYIDIPNTVLLETNKQYWNISMYVEKYESNTKMYMYMLRIDNGDLGTIWSKWYVFSDILVIFYSI